jgi:Zn-dependent protease
MAFDSQWLYDTILFLPGMLMALTFHEFAHARMALAFGDPTAARAGRVTLNPLAHLDPMGTILIIASHGFGWAKPVPVNPANLHPPRLGDAMVSLAGPASNVLLAFVLAGTTHLLLARLRVDDAGTSGAVLLTLFKMSWYGVIINITIFVFNLFPLFPLDGHHILREMLPWHMRDGFMQWQRKFGMFTLMALIAIPMFAGQGLPPWANPIGTIVGLMQHTFMNLVRLPYLN